MYNQARMERARSAAYLMLSENLTLRQIEDRLKISKSTVFRDLTEYLPKYDVDLFDEVRKVLNENKVLRAIRGGKSTSEYWKKKGRVENG